MSSRYEYTVRGGGAEENLIGSQGEALLRGTKWPAVAGILIYRGIGPS